MHLRQPDARGSLWYPGPSAFLDLRRLWTAVEASLPRRPCEVTRPATWYCLILPASSGSSSPRAPRMETQVPSSRSVNEGRGEDALVGNASGAAKVQAPGKSRLPAHDSCHVLWQLAGISRPLDPPEMAPTTTSRALSLAEPPPASRTTLAAHHEPGTRHPGAQQAGAGARHVSLITPHSPRPSHSHSHPRPSHPSATANPPQQARSLLAHRLPRHSLHLLRRPPLRTLRGRRHRHLLAVRRARLHQARARQGDGQVKGLRVAQVPRPAEHGPGGR